MPITRDEVAHLARLSRIALSDAELDHLAPQLDQIITAVAQVQEVAAEGKAVRVRRRQLMLSDGPFAETKEQVGGFCLIEAADLDEAVAVAAEHPAATYGTIEVRELWPPL